jgi:hypothetical protein
VPYEIERGDALLGAVLMALSPCCEVRAAADGQTLRETTSMESEASLLWGVLFGAIGAGYLMYAKKQRNPIALVAGMILIVGPYFLTNIILMVLVCIAAVLAPWFIRY